MHRINHLTVKVPSLKLPCDALQLTHFVEMTTLPDGDALFATEPIFDRARNYHANRSEKSQRKWKTEDVSTAATYICGVPISTRTLPATVDLLLSWLREKKAGRTIVFSNAHMLALAARDSAFRQVLRDVDINCADGMPVVVACRMLKGVPQAGHVPGPDFMPAFIQATAGTGYRHFILGGASGVAEKACRTFERQVPGTIFAGSYSPPYKKAFELRDVSEHCAMIRKSGADIVWVALGCPKQELWLHQARALLPNKLLLAVGQAVDIASGSIGRAPVWMRHTCLEWLYRLSKDPRRLWRRYLVYNSQFLYYITRESMHRG